MTTEGEPITNDQDIIDSRDVIARIAYLKASWADATGDDPDDFALSEDDWCAGLSADEAGELVALIELAGEAEGYAPDWHYGEALIRDSYFEDYARELAEDCGMVPDDAAWPVTYIDWPAAARALQQDYTSVSFGDVDYWVR